MFIILSSITLGAIPSSIGSLSAVNLFRANNNKLSGAIPSTLGSMVSLKTLILDTNELNGGLIVASFRSYMLVRYYFRCIFRIYNIEILENEPHN